MRIDSNGTIVLSRRNLLALLGKLEENRAGGHSLCLIVKNLSGHHQMAVMAEEDSIHYTLTNLKDPGQMSDQTEDFISKIERILNPPRVDLSRNSFKD
jgi:hypothetical protein